MDPSAPLPNDGEVSGDAAEHRRPATQWEKNEAELARLADLPVAQTDPADRERTIDSEQDEVEWALGEIYLRDRGEQIDTDG